MASEPTPFIPNEPPYGGGEIWQYREWFKQVVRWAKRAFNPAVTQTASFIADENYFFPVNASGGAVTVTLPPANTWTPGKPYSIKKIDASANAVTVARSGADLIDGVASKSLPAQYDVINLVCDGVSNWWKV